MIIQANPNYVLQVTCTPIDATQVSVIIVTNQCDNGKWHDSIHNYNMEKTELAQLGAYLSKQAGTI